MGALRGKIALVTGASRGIGEAIARRFGAEGATIVVSARTLEGKGRFAGKEMPGSIADTVAAIEALGGKAVGIGCDVADPASRAALADKVLDRFGRVDILVNNAAGATYGKLYHQVADAQYDWLWQLNVKGPFDLIQRLAPGMAERGHGWILNIGSRTAELPPGPPYNVFDHAGGVLLYGTTKAAIRRLTAGLAAEFQGSGVAVNEMAPFSVVWTPGTEAVGTAKYRGLPGWKEEPVEAMAECALALCSGDPATVTGQCVYSTEYLEKIGRPIRTLDGGRILENWTPAVP